MTLNSKNRLDDLEAEGPASDPCVGSSRDRDGRSSWTVAECRSTSPPTTISARQTIQEFLEAAARPPGTSAPGSEPQADQRFPPHRELEETPADREGTESAPAQGADLPPPWVRSPALVGKEDIVIPDRQGACLLRGRCATQRGNPFECVVTTI